MFQEKQICLTSGYRNLGIHSAQRNESFNHLVKAFPRESLGRPQEQPEPVLRNSAKEECSRTHIGRIHDSVAFPPLS